jgi:hypothetical protein
MAVASGFCDQEQGEKRFRTRSMYSARRFALLLAAATRLEGNPRSQPHPTPIMHFLVRFFRYRAGFRNFIPKHAFTRYCGLTIDSLVKGDHGPSAEGPASFHATRWTLCDALVASEGRLGP